MNDNFSALERSITILDRLMKMYYDHPGSSAQEMVECIRVDKATLTKTVKKLSEIDYIKIVTDEKDKRIKKMYLTEKAIPAAKRIKEIHNSFYQTLCSGISAPDILLTEQILDKMMKNINQKVWHRM